MTSDIPMAAGNHQKSDQVVSRPVVPGARKNGWKYYLKLGAAGLAGGILGYTAMKTLPDLFTPVSGWKWLNLVFLAALPLTWVFVIAVHEFGHVLGGWLSGGRFLLWMAGPMVIRRTPGGIRVGWNRKVNLGGGLALCAPLDPKLVKPGNVVFMILGGPLASLTLSFLTGLGAWIIQGVGGPGTATVVTCNLCLQASFLSLVAFVITAFPSSTGGFKSDGKRMIDLLRGDRRSDQESALLVLTTAGLGGVRPRDYPPALLDRAVALKDRSLFDLVGHFTAYYAAADRGSWSEAQALLDYVVAGKDELPSVVREAVFGEYAWLLGTRTTDAVAARQWLERGGNLKLDVSTRLRAEAAVLLLEGQADKALSAARAALHALQHQSISPVKSAFADEAILELMRRAENLQRNGETPDFGQLPPRLA